MIRLPAQDEVDVDVERPGRHVGRSIGRASILALSGGLYGLFGIGLAAKWSWPASVLAAPAILWLPGLLLVLWVAPHALSKGHLLHLYAVACSLALLIAVGLAVDTYGAAFSIEAPLSRTHVSVGVLALGLVLTIAAWVRFPTEHSHALLVVQKSNTVPVVAGVTILLPLGAIASASAVDGGVTWPPLVTIAVAVVIRGQIATYRYRLPRFLKGDP